MKSKNGMNFYLQKDIVWCQCTNSTVKRWMSYRCSQIKQASAQMNNYFKCYKDNRQTIHPKTTFDSYFVRIWVTSTYQQCFSQNLVCYGCQCNINLIKTWVIQNFQVQKCACQFQPHKLPWIENIYDKYKQPENKYWKTSNY